MSRNQLLAVVVAGCCGLLACPPKEVQVCSPGRSEACVGIGGCAGGQRCASDGSGWEACACAGSEADAGAPDGGQKAGVDAGVLDAGPLEHVLAVASQWDLPPSAAAASLTGFDLTDAGRITNQLGSFFGGLPQAAEEAATVSAKVDDGSFIVLVDVEHRTATATVRLYSGMNPQPPACASSSDVICRGHLDGGATFAVDGAPSPNVGISGTWSVGHVDAGGGTLVLPFVIGGQSVKVPVHGARVRADFPGKGSFGGAVAQTDVTTLVLPKVTAFANAVVQRDCVGGPPTCSCMATSTGASTIAAFDSSKDCVISTAELLASGLLAAPDVDIDGDGTPESQSFGLTFSTVPAAFTVP